MHRFASMLLTTITLACLTGDGGAQTLNGTFVEPDHRGSFQPWFISVGPTTAGPMSCTHATPIGGYPAEDEPFEIEQMIHEVQHLGTVPLVIPGPPFPIIIYIEYYSDDMTYYPQLDVLVKDDITYVAV